MDSRLRRDTGDAKIYGYAADAISEDTLHQVHRLAG
jgi:hypothetical protein